MASINNVGLIKHWCSFMNMGIVKYSIPFLFLSLCMYAFDWLLNYYLYHWSHCYHIIYNSLLFIPNLPVYESFLFWCHPFCVALPMTLNSQESPRGPFLYETYKYGINLVHESPLWITFVICKLSELPGLNENVWLSETVKYNE